MASSCRLAIAASFDLDYTDGGTPVITVQGELSSGDQNKFITMALPLERGAVILISPGGDLTAGIEIGKAIRLKEFITMVPAGKLCSSACGLAWLGGVKRLMYRTSFIGFHAAYRMENGQTTESGSGNAIVGAYLNQLGLTQSAITFLTSASPSGMNWFTPDIARSIGIEITELNDEGNPAEGGAVSENQNNGAPSPAPDGGGNSSQVQDPDSMTWLLGRDLFGFDIDGGSFKETSSSSCMQRCESRSDCRAFTFHGPSKTCYLKSNGRLLVGNDNAVTGFKASILGNIRFSSIHVLESMNIPGGDYRQLPASSLDVCIQRCSDDTQCTALTFSRKQGQCYLKNRAPSFVKDRIVSGIKGYDWEGVWSLPGGKCTQDSGTDMHPVQLSYLVYAGYEFFCDIKRVKYLSKEFRLDADCEGEGEKYSETLFVSAAGNTLSIRSKDGQTQRLQRCFAE